MEDLKRYTVLVVDDEDALRETIAFDFTRKGFTVLSANSGKTAYEVILAHKVHLVISDIRMPGGDGLSLLDQIRAHDPSLPVVILITGYAEATEAECIAKGAMSVVQKPFDRKLLMESVFKALGIVDRALAK